LQKYQSPDLFPTHLNQGINPIKFGKEVICGATKINNTFMEVLLILVVLREAGPEIRYLIPTIRS
jgi:hypothetical protein